MDGNRIKEYYEKIDVPMYLLEDTRNLQVREKLNTKRQFRFAVPVFTALLCIVLLLVAVPLSGRLHSLLDKNKGPVELVVYKQDVLKAGYVEGWYANAVEEELGIRLVYSNSFTEYDNNSELVETKKDVVIEEISHTDEYVSNLFVCYEFSVPETDEYGNDVSYKSFDDFILDSAAVITDKMLDKYGKNIKQQIEDGYLIKLVNKQGEMTGFASFSSKYYYGNIYYISSTSECVEEALKYLDYMASAEGSMTYFYGPKGIGWDVDDEGRYYLTETGKKCRKMEIDEMGDYGNFVRGQCAHKGPVWDIGSFIPYSAHGQLLDWLSWESPAEKPDRILAPEECNALGLAYGETHQIYYDEIVYEATVYCYSECPESDYIGKVTHDVNKWCDPQEDFYSAGVAVGSEIYMKNQSAKYCYVKLKDNAYVLFVPMGIVRTTDNKLYYEKSDGAKKEMVYIYDNYVYDSLLDKLLIMRLDLEKGKISLNDYSTSEPYGDTKKVSVEEKANRLYLTDEKENCQYVFEKVGNDYKFLPDESASLDNFYDGWGATLEQELYFKEQPLYEGMLE